MTKWQLFAYYLVFALFFNPIFVMGGLTVSYQVFGLDTAHAASSLDPFIPYLLVRLLFIPILIIPFIFAFLLLQEVKKSHKSRFNASKKV